MAKAWIVVGLGFGDEGKGSFVDYLVRENDVQNVVRFNGGAQAAHHVVSLDGKKHCFAQLGSGTLVPGTRTYLASEMIFHPIALQHEIDVLEDATGIDDVWDRLYVEGDCPVVHLFNPGLNQFIESTRENRHGTCGVGIGLTRQDVEDFGSDTLYVRDLLNPELTREKLEFLREKKLEVVENICRGERAFSQKSRDYLRLLYEEDLSPFVNFYRGVALKLNIISREALLKVVAREDTIFEGAQGALLDHRRGFFPYITRSDTTSANARNILREAEFSGEVETLGLLRGYSTRHGHGPFVTEEDGIEIPNCDNGSNEWQGNFRQGWFDAVAARYALEGDEIDGLVITNLDRMDGLREIKVCNACSPDWSMDEPFENLGDFLGPLAENPSREDMIIRTGLVSTLVPRYEVIPGWEASEDDDCLHYINRLARLVGKPVRYISISPTAGGKIRL